MPTKGFTLIEMLVSVGIFSVVMVVALGALLSMSEADRKAQTLKTVINNLNFAIESMSRNIRTGYDYSCGAGGDCTSGNTSMFFVGPTGTSIGYLWTNASAHASLCGQPSTAVGCILRSLDGSVTWQALTSPEVRITYARFYVTGSARFPDAVQPRVTILMSGEVPFADEQVTRFNIQTTVTQRIYDQ